MGLADKFQLVKQVAQTVQVYSSNRVPLNSTFLGLSSVLYSYTTCVPLFQRVLFTLSRTKLVALQTRWRNSASKFCHFLPPPPPPPPAY